MNQGGHSKGRKRNVWAIDARADVLEAIRRCCSDDFNLTCFSDARRAILYARRELPDLVILGLAKNTIEPLELLALRGEFDQIAALPAIAIYGRDDEVDVDLVMAEGVEDAVAVSCLEEELPRRIRWRLKDQHDSEVPSPLAGIDGRSALRTFDFMKRVIEASPNAIVAARRSGEIVLFNPAAVHILGWSEEEALGMHVKNLYPEGGARRIMGLMLADQYGGAGRIDSMREVVINVDGELIPVEISAALICEEGRQIATVGVFTDLRQQMTLEERLQEAMEALEKTQRQAVVAEVAGAAAHELNQPLTSLLGYVEYLRRKIDDEELQRIIATVCDDASRVAEVVRKIGRITRYRTRDYAGGEQIVDLEEASRVEEDVDHQKIESTAEMERVSLDDNHQ